MALVVVGGHASNVGKTAVAAGIIAATRERDWVAVKLEPLPAHDCPVHGRSCGGSGNGHDVAVVEEREKDGLSDTSRFLCAGAKRALWIRARRTDLHPALPAVRALLVPGASVIIEGSSILEHIAPDLYIFVVRYDLDDFKSSARRFLSRVDAVVAGSPRPCEPRWPRELADELARKPCFAAEPPDYAPPLLVEFVRKRLGFPGRGAGVPERDRP